MNVNTKVTFTFYWHAGLLLHVVDRLNLKQEVQLNHAWISNVLCAGFDLCASDLPMNILFCMYCVVYVEMVMV